MSGKSKKIKEASSAFAKSPEFEELLMVLDTAINKSGPLRAMHMDQAKSAFEAWRHAEKEVLFAEITDTSDYNRNKLLRKRMVYFTLLRMGSTRV